MIRKGIISKMLFSGAVVLALSSCSESYPGLEYDKTQGNKGIENQEGSNGVTPVMVFVNEQNIFSVKTRGVGAFEPDDRNNENRLANSTFYVYAFRNNNYQSGPDELKQPTDFTWYNYATDNIGRRGQKDEKNVNCLLDGTDYNYGMETTLHPHGSGKLEYKLEDGQEAPKYYSAYGDIPYNFFAYYLDDAKVLSANRSADKISYDIEIDGTQDLMCGYAPDFYELMTKNDPENPNPYRGIHLEVYH